MARFWRKHSEFRDERTARRIAKELREMDREMNDPDEREDVIVRKVYYWRVLTAPRKPRPIPQDGGKRG